MAAILNNDTAVRLHRTPAPIAGLLIRRHDWSVIPVALRDHAHNSIPERSRGDWWVIGHGPVTGLPGARWVLAKRLPDGTVAYGTEAE